MPKGIYDRSVRKARNDCACGCGGKTSLGMTWIRGHNPQPIAGKTLVEVYGAARAAEISASISAGNRKTKGRRGPSKLRGRKNPGVSKAKKIWWDSKTPEEKTEISKNWQHAGLVASTQKKPTKIELKVMQELEEMGVEYIYQYPFGRYVLDFYIPDIKVDIECDGDYWHSRSEQIEHDAKRDEYMYMHGIYVARLSESSINSLGGPSLAFWFMSSLSWSA